MTFKNFLDFGHVSISFIKSPISKVETDIEKIIVSTLNKDWVKRKVPMKNMEVEFAFIKESHFRKVICLFWQPESINFKLAVFLTNMPDGWSTLLNAYFNQNQTEIISITLSSKSEEYPLYKFEYKDSSFQRVIQGMRDSDKWKFFQTGSAMSFENTDNYKKKKISDRLNNEIIIEYLRKNGIEIDDPKFWSSNEYAIEFSTKLMPLG